MKAVDLIIRIFRIPTLPENLEKESGRGLFLMNTLADEVVFENSGAKVLMRFSNNIKNIIR